MSNDRTDDALEARLREMHIDCFGYDPSERALKLYRTAARIGAEHALERAAEMVADQAGDVGMMNVGDALAGRIRALKERP
jgi:hypothetical protein